MKKVRNGDFFGILGPSGCGKTTRLSVSEDGPRAFMLMLDGQKTVAELRALWAASPFADETGFDAALAQAISAGLLVNHIIL